MYTQIMRVVQQGETFAVQSQKSENGQMMKCNIVLQEMGGKYENQYAAAMLGNMAQCKYAPGELVAVTLRFTTHEHNGQVYQDILVTAVNERLQKDKTFILAGHFCIFDKSFNVERLPESVFSLMSISKVVLLESDVTKVCENLRYRDSRCYPLDALKSLKQSEKMQCEKITKQLGLPLYIHQMLFDDSDVQQVREYVLGGK